MICRVLKPINGPDGKILPPQVVDSTSWKNEIALINAGYLEPEPKASFKVGALLQGVDKSDLKKLNVKIKKPAKAKNKNLNSEG